MPSVSASDGPRQIHTSSIKHNRTRGRAKIEHPVDLLRQRLVDGDVLLDAIRYHIRATFLLFTFSARKDRESKAKEKPSVLEVLRYLRARNEMWLAFHGDLHAQLSLVSLTVAEGHGDLLTQYLKIEAPSVTEVGIVPNRTQNV